MAEIYPLRAPGDFAGTKCHVKECHQFSRYTVAPFQEANGRVGSCGTHLGMVIKGIHVVYQKSAVVQEVPGNWGHNERAVVDGNIHRIGAGSARPGM